VSAEAFAIGVATGIALVAVTAYVIAPNVAANVTRDAVSRQGSRILGLPSQLLTPLASQISEVVGNEVRAQLRYPGYTNG
jgi:hypothetical protein